MSIIFDKPSSADKATIKKMQGGSDTEEKQESFFSSFIKGKTTSPGGKTDDVFQVTNPMFSARTDSDFGITNMDVAKAKLPPGFEDEDYPEGRVPSTAGPRPPEGFSLDFSDEFKNNDDRKTSSVETKEQETPKLPPGFEELDIGKNKPTKIPPPFPSGFFSDSEDSDAGKAKRESTADSEPPLPGSISLYFPNGVAGVPKQPQQHREAAKDVDILAQFENHPHDPPELPPRRLKKTESAQSNTTSGTHPDLPPRRLKKTESTQSTTGAATASAYPVMKKTESQQSVLNNDTPEEGAKEPMKRRRTSFLEMLIKQKQERGEFNIEDYQEAARVLLPEEEQESGMSKQEIEEKIRRIAQASAAGHNTTAMGIGLRDIGYAVAKSRSETDAKQQKISVKTIAKHAEEMVIRNATSSQSQVEYTPSAYNTNNNGRVSRHGSSSASTAAGPAGAPLHPQHQRLLIDTIGEVSEGASSSRGESMRTDDTLVRTKMRRTAKAEAIKNKGMKSKTDRFFGSMRLNFNEPTNNGNGSRKDVAKQKLKQTLQQLRVKAEEYTVILKEKVKVLSQRAMVKKEELKVYIAEHRRNHRG